MKAGDKVTVYDDPLTEKEPVFKATLIGCTANNLGMHNGRILQRWLVRPYGHGQANVEVAILHHAEQAPPASARRAARPPARKRKAKALMGTPCKRCRKSVMTAKYLVRVRQDLLHNLTTETGSMELEAQNAHLAKAQLLARYLVAADQGLCSGCANYIEPVQDTDHEDDGVPAPEAPR